MNYNVAGVGTGNVGVGRFIKEEILIRLSKNVVKIGIGLMRVVNIGCECDILL